MLFDYECYSFVIHPHFERKPLESESKHFCGIDYLLNLKDIVALFLPRCIPIG
jgi:hypothetical protein